MTPIPFVVLALCGLAFGAVRPLPRLDGRIVGGEQTTIDKYPYQLSVRSGGYHFCGASIIGPNHALTAAHCVRNGSPNGISLHAGTSYKTQVGSKHNAVKVTVHPRYGSSDYDFAILEVGTPFPIGQEGIQSIELCSVEPSAGETSVISGWGAVSVSIIPYLVHMCQFLK
ncbi:epsilonTrypsin [Carabus blaptoides fortunei]